jgi:4-diphosphocytidyl-2-C-methyl-D-erythritol kinase
MPITRPSPCKVNLLLNILRRREDGFHELETIMQPVPLCDVLEVAKAPSGIALTCSEPTLPTDASNLVHKAATRFLAAAGISEGVKIHLEKRIPMAAGLGGGSGNAANTLLALNELFGGPLGATTLQEIAAALGSDVPFFLQDQPALATGRGEHVVSLPPFSALRGKAILLIHPGFGIATAWAYKELAKFPQALNGRPGRAEALARDLASGDLAQASHGFYNSLEAPALDKYPILALFQEFLREHGALAALMSGSGSTTFAIAANQSAGEVFREKFLTKFGAANWTAVVPFA